MTKKQTQQACSIPSGIAGLDEVLGGGYPAGKATVIRGTSGTGKTILSLKFACQQQDAPTVLVTFDEHPQSLGEQIRALGLDADRVSIIDMRPGPDIQVYGERFELDGLIARIELELERTGSSHLVFDSFDTLVLALGGSNRVRTELQRVFNWVRERGITLVATHALQAGSMVGTDIEDYLSDCVIHLKQQLHHRIMTRMLRIVKLRGRAHGTNEYPFSIGSDGIMVMPVSETRLTAAVSSEHLSTGLETLDQMLGGKGLFRGSITMVSGQSGTGKSSLSATLAMDACRKGLGTHYLTFEESPEEVLRNNASIGLNLKPLVDAGCLRIDALRSVEQGLEEHLMRIMRMVEQDKPDVLVIDPISALTDMGEQYSAKSMIVRLCSFMKAHGVTTVLNELIPDDGTDASVMNISSMIDTWIRLRLMEEEGRFARLIHVRKSRGHAIDKRVYSFDMSENGLIIRPS